MNCRYCGRSMANAWEEGMCRVNAILDSLTPSHDAKEAKDRLTQAYSDIEVDINSP